MEPYQIPLSQYHHFVPQFLLRNFSYPYTTPKHRARATAVGSNASSGSVKLYRGDKVVNCIDLTSEDPAISQFPVKRILGQQDMYRDDTRPGPEQQLVEKMFSNLESDFSTIIGRITTAFEKKKSKASLTRLERNKLRKFLFIMKYRGSSFYARYYHQRRADYDANDREQMLKYMGDRGFKRPFDVWLDNIKAVIDMEMDDKGKWMSDLQKRMYPDDAVWAVMHMQSMYLAICTPSDQKDEFVLTDNCYHVFEGPANVRINAANSEPQEEGWVSFHEFAPISPKLLIVLRSLLLPSPHHDTFAEAKAARQTLWTAAIEKPFKKGTTSILADLPVEMPGNNYSEVRDGTARLVPGEDGALHQHHKFFFRFSPVGSDHVNNINGVFLDNAAECKSVVFRSPESFLRTLEWYMTVEPSVIGKRVISSPSNPKLSCLKKLAAVIKHIGSSARPVWDEIPLPDLDTVEGSHSIIEALKKTRLLTLVQQLPDDNPTEFMQIYLDLG